MKGRHLLILFTLVACSSAGGQQEVRPFSDIAAADPVVEVDPSGTAAVVEVTTTMDMVCAVSYGTDGPTGALATDQTMGADGHSDHSPRLTGLEPGTEYQYRLQGVGADGALYRSEVFTFTTP